MSIENLSTPPLSVNALIRIFPFFYVFAYISILKAYFFQYRFELIINQDTNHPCTLL